MPVGSFVIQPIVNSVNAAYRPVIIRVNASSSNEDETARPPVVYCDIYFNDVFYKTLSKTQYAAIGVSSSEWQFDIQDAGQEFLGKFLATYGYASVVEAPPIICKAQVKIRSSQTNEDGFIEPEGTAPVQATAETPAIGGDGTTSNVFYIVNATLQQEDNQDLALHLGYFKHRTWTADALPLSHRPDGYKQGFDTHDMFPIIYLGTNTFKTLRLKYRFCGQSTFHQATANIAPAPSCDALISTLTVNQSGNEYGVSWSLISGSPAKYFISTPAISAGAPSETTMTTWSFGTTLPVGSHLITVRPLCFIGGEYYLGAAQTVTINVEEPPACVPVSYPPETALPNGTEDAPYLYVIPLSGTAPFSLSDIIKPAWMNIAVVGSEIQITGTPTDPGTDIAVSFTIENCSGTGDTEFSDTIDIAEAPEEGDFLITNTAAGLAIESVTPAFYTLLTGDFPVATSEDATGSHTGTSTAIEVVISGSGFLSQLQLIVDASVIETIEVASAGTYAFDPVAISVPSSVEIKLETV